MKNSNQSRKNFKDSDYKKFAKILKDAGAINVNLRKPLSDYQKRKIRDYVKGDNHAIFQVAKHRHDAKVKKYVCNKLDINPNQKISSQMLKMKMDEFAVKAQKGEISESVYYRMKRDYREMVTHYRLGNTSFGSMNFQTKKVTKEEKEILQAHGWTIINGKAFLPTNVNNSVSYLGVRKYIFPNGIEFDALVEHIKNSAHGHTYKYFLLGDAASLTNLLQNLQNDGIDSLDPDLLYTSPSKARDSFEYVRLHDSISEFLFYVTEIVNDKSHKNKTKSQKEKIEERLIEGMHILSHTKPTKGL